ncbi:MAG: M48 family metalloprotease [Magnetococcales bacterium]|nr:M48 family metalloprotease [Magnetococcales bacterium]
MNFRSRFALLCSLFLILVVGCETVPLTGRSQLSLISDSELFSLSFKQHKAFLKENRPLRNSADAEMVKRVGRRIQGAVERYMEQQGQKQRLANYQWSFDLVEDDEINAFCMPGGKVVFLTGILEYTRDEEGVAAVMGHEIAHAIANHGGERMSQSLLVEVGAAVLEAATEDSKAGPLLGLAYGLGTQFGVMLPFSRLHESEADHMGLIFMAMAGYDPSKAVDFWKRMSQKGQSVPEFFSTHPSDETRIEEIRKLLPKALPIYAEHRQDHPSADVENQQEKPHFLKKRQEETARNRTEGQEKKAPALRKRPADSPSGDEEQEKPRPLKKRPADLSGDEADAERRPRLKKASPDIARDEDEATERGPRVVKKRAAKPSPEVSQEEDEEEDEEESEEE